MQISDIVVLVHVIVFPSNAAYFQILAKFQDSGGEHADNQEWCDEVVAALNGEELEGKGDEKAKEVEEEFVAEPFPGDVKLNINDIPESIVTLNILPVLLIDIVHQYRNIYIIHRFISNFGVDVLTHEEQFLLEGAHSNIM